MGDVTVDDGDDGRVDAKRHSHSSGGPYTCVTMQ